MSSAADYDDEVTDLYRKSAGRVLGFLIGMGCDRGLAEEITDDAFLGARRYWKHVRTLEEPEGYVFKIARRERGKRQRTHEDRARALRRDPSDAVEVIVGDFTQDVEDHALLLQALQQLPRRMQESVVLRHVGDLSEAATADIMGVSVGTVKRLASVGRAMLRDYLDELRPSQGRNVR